MRGRVTWMKTKLPDAPELCGNLSAQQLSFVAALITDGTPQNNVSLLLTMGPVSHRPMCANKGAASNWRWLRIINRNVAHITACLITKPCQHATSTLSAQHSIQRLQAENTYPAETDVTATAHC